MVFLLFFYWACTMVLLQQRERASLSKAKGSWSYVNFFYQKHLSHPWQQRRWCMALEHGARAWPTPSLGKWGTARATWTWRSQRTGSGGGRRWDGEIDGGWFQYLCMPFLINLLVRWIKELTVSLSLTSWGLHSNVWCGKNSLDFIFNTWH